jgi:hypothetical protein
MTRLYVLANLSAVHGAPPFLRSEVYKTHLRGCLTCLSRMEASREASNARDAAIAINPQSLTPDRRRGGRLTQLTATGKPPQQQRQVRRKQATINRGSTVHVTRQASEH